MDDISYALERERDLRERIATLTRELDAAHAQLREADAVIAAVDRHHGMICWSCGDATSGWRERTKDAAWREEEK